MLLQNLSGSPRILDPYYCEKPSDQSPDMVCFGVYNTFLLVLIPQINIFLYKFIQVSNLNYVTYYQRCGLAQIIVLVLDFFYTFFKH